MSRLTTSSRKATRDTRKEIGRRSSWNEASQSESGSELDDPGDGQGEKSKEAMLAALEAHGRAMFGFGFDQEGETSEQGRKRMSEKFGSGDEVSFVNAEDEDVDEEDEDDLTDDGWGAEDEFASDSEDELMSSSE